MPFDVAFSLPDDYLMAFTIIVGQIDGGEWSWATMSWKQKDN